MKINNETSISISLFYKLIPNNIVKSKKQTDMYNICNLEKSLEKNKNHCLENDIEVPDIINRDLDSTKQHKLFYYNQYKKYNEDINKLDAYFNGLKWAITWIKFYVHVHRVLLPQMSCF